MKPKILLLILCVACLPASGLVLRYVHAWTAMAGEDIGKRLYTEDPSYVPSAAARYTEYARALPGFLLFAAPVGIGAVAPIAIGLLLLTRINDSSRRFRSAGWLLFAVCVASSGVLAYLGVISGLHGWPFLLLAVLLVVSAFYPIIPVRAHTTDVA